MACNARLESVFSDFSFFLYFYFEEKIMNEESKVIPAPINKTSIVRIVTLGEESIMVIKLPKKVDENIEIGRIVHEEPLKGGGGICCDSLGCVVAL